jgi:hypothetical protein
MFRAGVLKILLQQYRHCTRWLVGRVLKTHMPQGERRRWVITGDITPNMPSDGSRIRWRTPSATLPRRGAAGEDWPGRGNASAVLRKADGRLSGKRRAIAIGHGAGGLDRLRLTRQGAAIRSSTRRTSQKQISKSEDARHDRVHCNDEPKQNVSVGT